LREEHRLRVFGNRVLRRVCGPKGEYVGRRGNMWAEEGIRGPKREYVGRRGNAWDEEGMRGTKREYVGRRGNMWDEEGIRGTKREYVGRRRGNMWAVEEGICGPPKRDFS
jgi:hypothetical protein